MGASFRRMQGGRGGVAPELPLRALGRAHAGALQVPRPTALPAPAELSLSRLLALAFVAPVESPLLSSECSAGFATVCCGFRWIS